MTIRMSAANRRLCREALAWAVKRLGRLRGRGRIADSLHGLALAGEPWLVEGRLRNGARAVLNLRDFQQRMAFYLGEIDPHCIARIIGFLEPGDVFVDVGANVGLYAISVSVTLSGNPVIGFEPVALNVETFRQNVALNALEERVLVVPKALSDRHEWVDIRTADPEGPANAVIVSDWVERADPRQRPIERVETVSFDEWARENPIEGRIGLVKIDVEGHEVRAIRGMLKSLARDLPIIYAEQNAYFFRKKGVTAYDVLRMLTPLGYQPYGFSRRGLARVERFGPSLENVWYIANAEHLSGLGIC